MTGIIEFLFYMVIIIALILIILWMIGVFAFGVYAFIKEFFCD